MSTGGQPNPCESGTSPSGDRPRSPTAVQRLLLALAAGCLAAWLTVLAWLAWSAAGRP